VMRAGRLHVPAGSLGESRRRAAAQLAQLPDALRTLDASPAYEVRIAPALATLARTVDRAME
jgi:nicotinate phosphoribosyltransferase